MRQALIIDDSDFIRKTIELILRKKGIASFQAVEGSEALELLSGFLPDIIITDYNMPEMDGLSFLKRLRELPACGRIPVIMVSTTRNPEIIARARNLGALWLSKPFRTPQLLAAIEQLTPVYSAARAAD